MGRTKMKQLVLSPNLNMSLPSKENLTNNNDSSIKKPRGRPKNSVLSPTSPNKKVSPISSNKKVSPNSPNKKSTKVAKKLKQTTLSKMKGGPKPQAKAFAKFKSLSKENEGDKIQQNNNNHQNKSPINNNVINNNNNEVGTPVTPSKKSSPQTKKLALPVSIEDDDDEIQTLPLPDKPSSPKKAAFEQREPPSPKGSQKGNGFSCKICHKWFPNRYFQRKHRLMDHEDQLYECRVCSFNSIDPEKLKSHIIKLHVTKKERTESISFDNMQDELEKMMDQKIPRKVMMEDGVTLGRDISKMKYYCALCGRMYTSKYSLERHVRCHTLEKPYQCDVCPFESSYREHMIRHMTSVHLIVHSDAPKVKYMTKKKRGSEEGGDGDGESNDNRKRRNILRERFECAVCGTRATHKTDLMDHIRIKHPHAHIESLVNNDGSKVHLIVTKKKSNPAKKLTIQCEHCSLMFHDTWKYKVHLRSHTGIKPFECSICDLRASSKMTVRDHIHRKHTQSQNAMIVLRTVGIDGNVERVELPVPWKEFKCEHCNEIFQDNYNLKLHRNKLHSLPFTCSLCNHKDKTVAKMVIHCQAKHENDNMYNIILHKGKPAKVKSAKMPTCDICNRVFPYQSQLNIHTRLHTGEKELSCSHCDYQTNLKTMLAKHIQGHYGIGTTRKNVKQKGNEKNVKKTVKKAKQPKQEENKKAKQLKQEENKKAKQSKQEENKKAEQPKQDENMS